MTASNIRLGKNRLFILLVVVLFIGSACSLLSPSRTSAKAVTQTPNAAPTESASTATSAPAASPTLAPAAAATLPPANIATDMPMPTDTPAPAQPAATQSAGQTATAKVLFDDNFSSQDTSTKNGWTFGNSDSFDQQWMQGMQSFNLKSANNIFWDYLPQTYQDVAVTIEVQPATTGYVEYGIIFGIVPGTGTTKSEYLFSVDNEGEYYLQKMTNDQWAPVTPSNQAPIPTIASPYLNTGQGRNQLGVIYLGGTIYLYANGHFLNSYKDPKPITGAGNAGLNFQTEKDVPVTVNLYRYTVYDPQSALDAWGSQPSTTGPTQTANSAKVILDDNFTDQAASTKNGWSFGTSSTFDQIFQNGMQVFNLKSSNGIFWDYLPQDYGDVAVSIDVQPTTKGYVEYGIIFRVNPATNKNEYLFSADNQGEYYLQKMVNGQWAAVSPTNQSPIPLTKSPVLNTGMGRNQLAVIVLGDMIYLYANGHYLNSYMDPSPIKDAGKVGLNFQTNTDIPESVNLFRFTLYDAQSALDTWGTNP
jgi:hypothetical protein